MNDFLIVMVIIVVLLVVIPWLMPLMELYGMYCDRVWDFCER